MPAWWVSTMVVGLLLCSTMVDAHAFLSFPSPRGQFANPKKRIDEEQAPTGISPNDQAFVCRNDPEMPRTNWASLTAGQSQPITITYDARHPGDCFVYLTYDGDKPFNQMKWFKIWEMHECYTRTNFDVPIPDYLPSGSHVIFRWEWYALHQYPNFVEYYAQCVDATVSGSASGKLPQPQVNMPGHLPTAISEYWDPYAYPVQEMRFTGPRVATIDGSSTPVSTTGRPSSSTTTGKSSTTSGSSTVAPTNKPTTPTYAPTNPPSSGGSNIKVALNDGSSSWWVGVVISGGGETTVKVELTDSGSYSSWVTLSDQSYAYVYEPAYELKAPISLRLTSSTGKQVVLPNIITSLYAVNNFVDSGKSYSGSSGTSAPTTKPTTAPTSAPTTKPTTAPTAAPTTKPTTAPTAVPTTKPTTKPTTAPTAVPTTKPTTAPTSAPTTKPTTKPSTANPKVNVYADSNQWWLALTVSSAESISKIELKDAGTRTTYQPLTNAGWAYTFSTQGVALVTPLTVKVTTTSGKVTFTTMNNITPGASLETNSQ